MPRLEAVAIGASAARVVAPRGDGRHAAVTDAFEKGARESRHRAHTIRELLFGRADPAPITLSEVETVRMVKGSNGRGANGKGTKVTRRRAR